ncbi:MAG TPA: peptidoglycan recognition family protein [Phycisphaerales bacterium]|nr:peptidoglycan recognition family protein [Phycisphaerales bacterium]
MFGLLSLVGCAADNVASSEPLPNVPWPEPPKGPAIPPQRIVERPQPQPAPVQPPQVQQPIASGLPTGVLPRTRWTSPALANPSNARPMKGVNCITIHHDGMKPFFGESEADSVARLRAIRNAHTNRRSRAGERWADIGYHFIIDRGGRVWEGRPLAYQGAHVEDENEHNIGVMCLGNFQDQAPTQAQKDRLDQFVAQLMRDYRIPLRAVRTHKEWPSAQTDCPGRNLQQYMARTRGRGGAMALAIAQSDPVLLA